MEGLEKYIVDAGGTNPMVVIPYDELEKYLSRVVNKAADMEFEYLVQLGTLPYRKCFTSIKEEGHGEHTIYELTTFGSEQLTKLKEKWKNQLISL